MNRIQLIIAGFLTAIALLLWMPSLARADTFVWPVYGCPLMSSHGQWVQGRAHTGIDLGCGYGHRIVASKAGYVTYAGWDTTGYGNRVDVADDLNTPDYNDRLLYGHLNEISVWWGSWVEQGQQLGTVGATGNATGPHLHLEVLWKGGQVDPILPLP